MPIAHQRVLSGLRQQIDGVLADRLEHDEARLDTSPRLVADQAVVEQRRERYQDVEAFAADRLGGLEREAAAEDGDPSEQPLPVVIEKLVAPLDRIAKPLVT